MWQFCEISTYKRRRKKRSEKIRKLIFTPDYESRITVECGAMRTDFIEFISMVKKIAKLFIPADNLPLNAKKEK